MLWVSSDCHYAILFELNNAKLWAKSGYCGLKLTVKVALGLCFGWSRYSSGFASSCPQFEIVISAG